MLIDVTKMIIPIIITFALGIFIRKAKIMDQAGCSTIKRLVSKIMLPVVLLNAFLFADYQGSTLIIMAVVFVSMLIILGAGSLLSRMMPERAKYMPFLFTTLECGTLGYPLAAMLLGTLGTSHLAIIDVGHTIFLFFIAVPLLQTVDKGTSNLKDVLKNAVCSPTFDAMLIGIILGILGVDDLLSSSAVYDRCLSFNCGFHYSTDRDAYPDHARFRYVFAERIDQAGFIHLITASYDHGRIMCGQLPVHFQIHSVHERTSDHHDPGIHASSILRADSFC